MSNPKLFTLRRVHPRKRWAIVMTVMLLMSPGGSTPKVKAQVAPVGSGFTIIASDLRFIYQQILVAQNHAAGNPLFGTGPNQVSDPQLPRGLRTVDGTFNNLVQLPGRTTFGAADQVFPRLTTPVFRDAEPFDPDGPGPAPAQPTSYTQKKGVVVDSQPRIITNLVVDQSMNNPAAVNAALNPCGAGGGAVCPQAPPGTVPATDPDSGALFIPNITPDFGLSAPFNLMFTFFGQFFDHGLDLVNKGGGAVFMPLQPDDPLYDPGPNGIRGDADDPRIPTGNFMVLTRALNQPGPDGVLGDNPATPQDESADDIQDGTNQTTPWVDQNQTYTSHPSHQVFLREYVLDALGHPVPDGQVLEGGHCSPRTNGPGQICNIANWREVKAQAATRLGILLSDQDVFDVPLIATDPYGHFKPGPNGFPLIVMQDNSMREGNPAAPISVDDTTVTPPLKAFRTGHAFLNDIAHNAVPQPGDVPDADGVVGPSLPDVPGVYDDELLNEHFVTGDGRGNENIALSMVHQLFHSEHNRLRNDIDRLVSGPAGDCRNSILFNGEPDGISRECLDWHAIDAGSGWGYGERLFQASRFVTEMEYQHLVFEEFARKIQPLINPFLGGLTSINAAIKAEFAHTTYRLGHSMLPERVGRINADGTDNSLRLLTAFLNPTAYNDGGAAGVLTADKAAGSLIRGLSRQVGNELDEFVTASVRNTLVGLPLDLPAINIARGRSEGIPPLNEARRQIFNATHDTTLAPYNNWFEYGLALRHFDSLVNFMAAYGTHPSITGATTVAGKRAAAQALFDASDLFLFASHETSGLDNVDLWPGGMAEKPSVFGGLLGSTMNYVFELQLEQLQDGDRFYYLQRLDGLNLVTQLEGNSLAELARRNTDLGGTMDVIFNTADFDLDVADPRFATNFTFDPTDPTSARIINLADGTKLFFDPIHRGFNIVFNGTADNDRMSADVGDDTMFGNGGSDRMQGGEGNDTLLGGEGDDVLFGGNGDDVLKGGDGNDAMSSGPGFGGDLLLGGNGSDFLVGGNDGNEYFAGPGNDIIVDGSMRAEAIIGGPGDDWIYDGEGHDGGMFGDEANIFDLLAGLSSVGGNDVMGGGPGQDNHFGEGGDEIFIISEGTNKYFGDHGFDWITHQNWPEPANVELDLLANPNVNLNFNDLRNRFRFVDGASGWILDDSVRGSNNVLCEPPGEVAECLVPGMELTAAGAARIAGLTELMGPAGFNKDLNDPAVPGIKGIGFMGGDILLGGPGSDVLEGKLGDDLIDGDVWLHVFLEAPINGVLKRFDSPIAKDETGKSLVDYVFMDGPGRLNPGDIHIGREIITGGAKPTDIDTAVFAFNRADYIISAPDPVTGTFTVTHVPALPKDIPFSDGSDTLRNIERLQFADITINSPTAVTLVTVPPVVGATLADAQTALSGAGLTSTFTTQESTSVAINRVISQDPAGSSSVPAGTSVALVVSFGTTVPSVVGKTRTDAATAIVAKHLVFSETSESSNAPVGEVIRQTPAGGTNVEPGSTVAVVTSNGVKPAPVVVQTVRGVSQGAPAVTSPSLAGTSLTANTLLVAFVSADAPTTPPNTIVASMTNTGAALGWTNAVRSNAQLGTAEIWWTYLTAPHAAMTVTANLSNDEASMITVVAFTGASPLTGAATATANAPSGAIAGALVTTRPNSLVYAAGTDWDRPRTLVPGAGQAIVTQFRPAVGDTYWVQRATSPVLTTGTTVVITDTYGATGVMPDRWNLALIEIRTP